MSTAQEQEFGITPLEYEILKKYVRKKVFFGKFSNEESVEDITFLWMEEARKDFDPAKGKSLRKFMYTIAKGGEMYLGKAKDKFCNQNLIVRSKKDDEKSWDKKVTTFSDLARKSAEGEQEYPDFPLNTESALDKLIRAEEERSDEDRESELDSIELQFTFYTSKLQQYMLQLEKQQALEKLYCLRAMLGLGKQQDINRLKGQKSKNATYWRDKVLDELAVVLKLEKVQAKRMLSCIKKNWVEEKLADEFSPTRKYSVRTNVYASALGINKTFQPHLFLL